MAKKIKNRYAQDPEIKELYGDNPINPLDGIRLSDLYGDNIPEEFSSNVAPMRAVTSTMPSPLNRSIRYGSLGTGKVNTNVIQSSDWGDSRFDETFIQDAELTHYQENRNKQQSSFEKLGLGISKILPRAAALPVEALGMAYAAGESLVTDKTFSEAMQNQFKYNIGFILEDELNDAVRIYKPEDYEERNLWQRFGTNTFWSDGIIGNFGFQLGAKAIFRGVQIGITKVLVKATEKAILNGSKAARAVQAGLPMLIAGHVSSVGEAGVEARSFYNDIMEDYKNKDIAENVQPLLEEIDRQYGGEPELAYQLKNSVMDEHYRRMEDYGKIASKEALKVYNYNKVVLSISNILQSSMLFKSNFKGNLTDVSTYTVKGQLKQLGNKYGLLNVAKNIASEGGEEGFQHIGQDVAKIQTDRYRQDYINNAYSLDNLEFTTSFMKDFGQAFVENMSDVDFWEEFAAGAIMGGFIPHLNFEKNNKGKRRPKLHGGITDLWRTGRQYRENQEKIDKLNEQLSKYDNITLLKAANVVFASQQRQKEAEYTGNKKDFEDENVLQAATLIASLSEIGRGDLLLHRIKELREHYSDEQSREKLAVTDKSQGGLSEKGSDGSELNEYAKLATDEEREAWLNERFDKAEQMIKDLNTISYNIRRILPSDISSQDLLPLVIDRYRLYESEERMKSILDHLYENAEYYASITGNPQVGEDIKNWYTKNKNAFDTHTLIEGQKNLNSRAIAAKNLIALGNRLSKSLEHRPEIYKDMLDLLSYLNDYIKLNNDVVNKLNKPETIQQAREKAEQNLSKKYKEKSFEQLKNDFEQADDSVKYEMYNRASDEEKQWLDKNGKKEDIDFIKEKNKIKESLEKAMSKVDHAAITPEIKANVLTKAFAVINGMRRDEIKNLDNVLPSIQAQYGQNLYEDYALEQALNFMKNSQAFKDRFKTFVPIITTDQINFQYVVDEAVGNDKDGGGTPTVTPTNNSKGFAENSGNVSSEDLQEKNQIKDTEPVTDDSNKDNKDNKNYIYPAITEEHQDTKYGTEHKPFWETHIEQELLKVLKDPAKVKEYIENLKKTPWQAITSESTDPKNIENGTYRGYYDVWTYLNEHHAFEYVNLGNIKADDKVTFTIDKKLSDDVIFITTKSGQIIGVLPQTGVTGIKELREKIKSDLNKGSQTISTNITKVMNGVVQYTETEQSLSTIGNNGTKLAILANDGFKGNGIDDVVIETWGKDISKYVGSVFALVPTARGTYFPVLLRTSSDFDGFRADNTINNLIKETAKKLINTKNLSDFDAVIGEIRKLLYLGNDVHINAYKNVTTADGKTHLAKITDKNEGAAIAAIGISSAEEDAKHAQQFEETGESDTTIKFIRIDDEQALQKLLSVLAERAIRYNVVSTSLNEGTYNENLFNSGILSTNVLQLNNLSSCWFTLPYYDASTGKFSENKETPKGQKGTQTQPIKGKDSVSIDVTFQSPFGQATIKTVGNTIKYYLDGEEVTDSNVIQYLNLLNSARIIFSRTNNVQDINYVNNQNGEYYYREGFYYKLKSGVIQILNADDENEKKEIEQIYEILKSRHEQRRKDSVVAAPIESQKSNVSIVESYNGPVDDDRGDAVINILKSQDTTRTKNKTAFNIFDQSIIDNLVDVNFVVQKDGTVIKTKGFYLPEHGLYITLEQAELHGMKVLFARFVNKNGASHLDKKNPIYTYGSLTNIRQPMSINDIVNRVISTIIPDLYESLKKKKTLPQSDKNKNTKDTTKENVQQTKTSTLNQKIQQIIDNIVANSKRFQLTEDGTYYRDVTTGKLYARVTSVISTDEEVEKFDPESPWILPSTTIGTTVDEFIRDFFAGTLKSDYPNATETQWSEFKTQLENLKSKFDELGWVVVPRDVTVEGLVKLPNNKVLPVAGTLDLLVYDTKKDEFVIIDIKTVRNPNSIEDKKHKWSLQTSMYQDLLSAKYGIKVGRRVILPVHVSYPSATENDYMINGQQLLVNGEVFEAAKPEILKVVRVDKNSGKFNIDELSDAEKKLLNEISQEAPNTADFDTNNNDSDVDADLNMPLERAAKDTVVKSDADLEKELSWLKEALPQTSKEDRVRLVNTLRSIDGRTLYGQFSNGVIYILKQGPKGTVYHEAFHLVSNCVLTSNEQNQLYDAARQRWGNLNDRDIEEKLAEAFTNYMIDEEYYSKTLPIIIKKCFSKIVSFFKSLFGINDPKSVMDKLFEQIQKGNFKNRNLHTANKTYGNIENTNNSTLYREDSILQKIQKAANMYTMDFITQEYDATHLYNYIIPALERGAKKLKISHIHIIAPGDEYHKKIDKVIINNNEVIFDRNVDILTKKEQVFGKFETSEELGRNRLDYEFLTNTQQRIVNQYVGLSIWEKMSKEQRENVLNCK